MKKSLFLILVFLSAVILLVRFGVNNLVAFFGYQQKAGVKITSTPKSQVFINEKEIGETPYQNENLKPEEYHIKLKGNGATWQGRVKLTPGTLAVVNRELSVSVASSSGEVLTLTTGRGVTITSTPDSADLEIDGRNYGKTPKTVFDLAAGEHGLLIGKSGFLKRSIRAYLPEKLSLNVDVDLAISEADLAAFAAPVVIVSPQVIVKTTPTGFLRVRDKPSLSGQEIGRVSPGDKLMLLEELSGWMKVKAANDLTGYVSSQYVEKLLDQAPR